MEIKQNSANKNQSLMLFVAGLFSITQLLAFLKTPTDLGIMALFIFIPWRFFIFRRLDPFRNLTSLMTWVIIDIEFFTASLLWPVDYYLSYMNYREMNLLITIGSVLLLIHGMITLGFKNNLQSFENDMPSKIENIRISEKRGVNVFLLCLATLVIAFVVSYLSNIFGITAMGVLLENLPFKLAGMLNMFRRIVVPLMIVCFIDALWDQGKKRYIIIILFVFLIWSFYESIIRLSRGVILINFLTLFFWIFVRKIVNAKQLVVIIAFLLGIVYMFPIMSSMRHMFIETSHTAVSVEMLREVKDARNYVELDDTIKICFVRMFSNGVQIAKFSSLYHNPYIENVFGEVIDSGGAVKYHTRVIDGYPEDYPHSSGISGYGEAYLLGGLPMVLLTGLMFSILSNLIDHNKLGFFSKYHLSRSISIKTLFRISISGIWQFLHKPILQTLSLFYLFIIVYLFIVLRKRIKF